MKTGDDLTGQPEQVALRALKSAAPLKNCGVEPVRQEVGPLRALKSAAPLKNHPTSTMSENTVALRALKSAAPLKTFEIWNRCDELCPLSAPSKARPR